MTSSARAGRRRRMLHDGALASPTETAAGEEAPQRVRFTPPEGSASFAVARRVAPRSVLALAALVVGLGVITAGLAWADRLGVPLTDNGVSAATARLFKIDQPGSLAAWGEAGLWLAVSAQCLLLFGLRKHRTDDVSGAYRWWLFVALLAVGMSLSAATHTTAAVAGQVGAMTGFSPLAADAFWWLAPGGLLAAAVAVRSFFEVKESPLAVGFGAVACVAAVVAAAATAGLIPVGLGSMAAWAGSSLVGPIAWIAVASCVLLSLLSYSRRIVLEAEGAVSPPAAKPAPVETESADPAVAETEPSSTATTEMKRPAARPPRRASQVEAAVEEVDEVESYETPPKKRSAKSRREAKPSLAKETTSDWVSGAEDYTEDYDDGPKQRKLSKAERKRLRREKERRAA